MPVFSKIRDFLYRHRNKFVVGGIIISGSILLSRYAQQKLREWQENEAKEFLDRTRKQQHFENTERTCNQTILSLIATLNETLAKNTNSEEIVAELRGNPDNKVQLWENLKVLVFSRVCSLIYVSVMLVITLRIQLNIIGGYLFKDPSCASTEMQQRYLSLCQNLLNVGIHKITETLQKECDTILLSVPLTKQLTIDDVENVFWTIQTAVKNTNGDPIDRFRQYIITETITDSEDVYNKMLQDTADLLESEEVKSLATSCINRSFVLLGDQLSQYYGPGCTKITELQANSVDNSFVHPARVKVPLAKLIPIINGLFAKNSLPDLLVQQLIINDKLKTLGANIYETFSYNS